jgi:putative tryptophan/tyrosine transport system substrate-binding protein
MKKTIAGTIIICLLIAFTGTDASQPNVPLIGYLSRSSASANLPRVQAFRQGLRELGYVEGKNIVIEFRYADGNFDRVPDITADLVRLKPDVIVAPGTGAVGAERRPLEQFPSL